jgi:hypothetical protein
MVNSATAVAPTLSRVGAGSAVGKGVLTNASTRIGICCCTRPGSTPINSGKNHPAANTPSSPKIRPIKRKRQNRVIAFSHAQGSG